MKRRLIISLLLVLVLPVLLLAFQASSGIASPKSSSSQRPRLENFSNLPLAFEPNQGQSDPQVKFLARGKGYGLLVTSQEAVLKLKKTNSHSKPSPKRSASSTDREDSTVLRLKFEGARTDAAFESSDKLPGVSNYFIGNDRSKWRKNIPQYSKVAMRGLYPGVDMVYYGNQGKLEYDFVVQPGTDPHSIHVNVEGADDVQVNAQGDMELQTGHGKVIFRSPAIYQNDHGQKRSKSGHYKLKEGNQIGFEVDDYDHSKPLVIDPVLDYSTYDGGEVVDGGQGIAVDGSGNAYITGYTQSTAFPTTSGTIQTSIGTTNDCAFVSGINSAGTALLYSTYLGGSGDAFGDGDLGYGIAVDGSGNAYVTGYTTSTDFPTQSPIQGSLTGFANVFVTEIASGGGSLLFSTYFGGTNVDLGLSIAVNGTGIYVTGLTYSTNFPTFGPIQAVNKCPSYGNAFVFKLSSGGAGLAYSTYLGGNGNGSNEGDTGNGIAVDAAGNAYVGGSTCSSNFPTTAGAFQTAHGADNLTGPAYYKEDGFITKINSAGTTWVYSTYLGGAYWYDSCAGIAVDGSGNAFVTGYTYSTNFPTLNAIQASKAGVSYDAFVTEMNPTGAGLVYSTYLGGTNNDYASSIAIDGNGDVYITGNTISSNFPMLNPVQGSIVGTYANAFVSEIVPTGPSAYALYFSTYMGGSGGSSGAFGDGGNGIATNGAGQIYVTGFTNSTDFPTTAGVVQPAMGGAGAQNAMVFEITNPLPTATNTRTNTPTNTFTVTSTNTATNTPTNTPTSTATPTPTSTSTNSPTSSATQTPTNTTTSTATPSATNTPIITAVTITAPYPNPVNGTTPLSVNVQAPTGSTFEWTVFTLAFRKILDKTEVIPYNDSVMSWDLKDTSGTSVANGLYYIRVQVKGPVNSSKILKVLIAR